VNAENRATLNAILGTEVHRAFLALLRDNMDSVLQSLAAAPPDEVLKLQGEYRALRRLESLLRPKSRASQESAPSLDETSGY
jgi:hypothetical protein